MRVVLNEPTHAKQCFPVERVAPEFVSPRILEERGIPRSTVGEISRFILASKFRSRRGEAHWPDGMSLWPDTHCYDDRRSVLHPILGLMCAAVEVSAKRGLRYWYAGMEPRFERRLRHMGIVFDPISPIIDYHGPCRAYLTHVPTLLRRVRELNYELWTLFTDAGRIRFYDDTDYHPVLADAQA
jgi:N-acyl amino acid synthase of PEP-CTERM/exosortase system